MTEYLIITNSNKLVRVHRKRIVCITADGSYTQLILTEGKSITFSFNLSSFEKMLESQLDTNAQIFVRLGKSLIINMDYIFTIDLVKHELTLSSGLHSDSICLNVSKEALKLLKSTIENSLNKQEE